MPIFNEEGTLPLSRFDISPDYEQSPLRRLLLGVAGYKANGTSTGWGRFLDITGGGIARNLVSREIATGDTRRNIKDDFSSSLSGLQVGVGIAQTALGMVGPGSAGAAAESGVATGASAASAATGTPPLSPKLQDGSFSPSAMLDGAGASATSTGSAGASSSQVDKNAAATSAGSLGGKKNNFSMNGIQNIIGGITGLAQGANADLTADDRKHVYLKYFKCGGKLKMEEGGMLYEKNSNKEDVDIVDKKTGQKVAEMRYGERIFSQRASVVMEELAELGDEEALGKFVAHEIREQERVCEECGMQERACECDEETKMKKYMPTAQSDAMLGMKLKKMSAGGNLMKLKRFKLGGKLGGPDDPEDPRLALVRKMFPNAPINKGLTAITGKMDAMKVGRLSEHVDSMSDKELISTFGTKDKGAIISKIGEYKKMEGNDAFAVSEKDPSSPVTSFANYTQLAKPTIDPNVVSETAAKAELAMNPGKYVDPVVEKAKEVDKANTPIAATDILNDSYNVFGALISGIQGAKGLPSWQVPGAFQENLNKLKQRSEMGLTDVEKSYATDMIGRNYDRDIANIAATAGGGGSSGATLAASRAASEAAQGAGTKLSLANIQAMDSGRAAYTSELAKSVNLDRTLFEDQYTADAARQKAASETLIANMKAINDRGDYNKTYGPGSQYSRLQDAILMSTNMNTLALQEKIDEARNARKVTVKDLSERDQKTFATGN